MYIYRIFNDKDSKTYMEKNSEGFIATIKTIFSEWKWMLKYIKRYVWIIVIYCVIGIVGTGMGLSISVVTKTLIDAVISHNDSTIFRSAVLAISFALGQTLFSSLTSWITAVISSKVNNEIRSEIYTKIVYGKWQDINDFHSGELLNRLEGDVSSISNGVITLLPNILSRTLNFFGALGIVLYYDATMAFLAMLSAPVLVLSSRFMIRQIRRYSKESREINGQVLSYSEESLQNIQILKAFDLTRDYAKNFRELLNTYRKVSLDFQKISILMTLVMSIIGIAISYACYGWGVYRLWQGAITYGTMTLFLSLTGSLSSSFSALVGLVPNVISIATSAGRVKEITEHDMESDEERERALSIMQASEQTGVEFTAENVTFTYKDGINPVMREICFYAKPGETIAFVGPSGEGKTTILRLILGLLEPDSGTMQIKSSDGKIITVSDSTRRFCAYVPQNMSMFTGTIADNLRIVKPDATDDELIDVLKIAEIWDYISRLPKGLNTDVSERGVNFSEGQIQRISIARALLRNAMILVMDEATSALDADTEDRVLKNMMTYRPNVVRIITTHRPSMLQYCDRIYKIDESGHMNCQVVEK